MLLDQIINSDMLIFYFYYPRFSYTCWFGIQLFVAFFEAQYLLTYLVLALMWLVGVHSDAYAKYIMPVTNKLFFDQTLLHPLLMGQNTVLTMDKMNYKRTLHSLFEDSESD